ncbi:TonB-dependent receptor [Chitinophaga sp. 22321]|uniref:TonB-dependent receptor n=1 Tax=Chitinophaga hostae TaxID=2831022 RepID=A0ABS5IYZ7_9BACT|nr:TonB-dependent receptor [Chitinophaga hostae]MBS0028188.1 TonB-dependent receptor [Chitinophaga hostae]
MKKLHDRGEYFGSPPLTKFLRVMKLTAVFLLGSLMTVTANSYSQNTRITLSLNNVKLTRLFKAIEAESGYRFAYSNDIIPGGHLVNVQFKDMPVTEALGRILSPVNLKYRFIEETGVIIVSGKAPSPGKETADRIVTGKVTNEEAEALPGVTVHVKDRKIGTTTNAEGAFSISMPEGTNVLVLSYVGMETQEVEVNGKNNLEIRMKNAGTTINDVVVVGYGSNTKRNVLQSVSTVAGAQLAEIPVATLSQSLAARAPGLFVTAGGGKPGRSSSVRIRAYDGIGSALPPLYVIDGVIVDQLAFDGLDATEVENISILKDGAAAAVYGVRGANGVIVVTTRKGIAGPPKINFLSSYSIDEATKVPEMLSAYDQAVFINDYIRHTDPNWQSSPAYFAQDELDYWKSNSVNLLDKYFKRPQELRNTLNLSGGGEKATYFVSGTYYNGKGSFNNIEYQKYNLRARIDAQVSKDLSVSVNLNSDIRKDQKPYWRYDNDNDDMTDLYSGLLQQGKMKEDYITVDGKKYPVGNFTNWHPGEVVNSSRSYNRKRWNNYQALLDVTYRIPGVKGLKARGSFAYYNRSDFRKELNLPYTLYLFKSTGSKQHLVSNELDPGKIWDQNAGNWLRESYATSNFYQLNLYLDYARSFGKHNISATAVYEQSETNDDNFFARNQYLLAGDLDQLSLGSSDPKDFSLGGGEFDEGRLAGLGRVMYDYAGKYLLETAFRYEGSRYFIPSNRYAFFPSVSVGWRISEERFFKDNIRFINDLKLRGSWGMTGQEPRFNTDGSINKQLQWEQYYRKVNGAFFGGLSNGIKIGTLPNEDITWAKKRSLEFGVDAQLLNRKVTLSATRFLNRRSDILTSRQQSIPTTFGASLPLVNYGIVESSGYELEIAYRNTLSKNVAVRASFNYGYATTKQVQIDEASNIQPYQSQLGRPAGGLFALVATDIIRTQADLDKLPAGYTINGAQPRLGMLNFRDIRGATSDKPDGKIDDNDKEFVANYSTPPSTFGIAAGITWKGLSVDVLVQGVGNYYRFRMTMNNAQWMEQGATSAAFWKDHWTPENPNAAYPIYGNYGGTNGESTFWMDNASFVRLKNLNIGWVLPSRVMKRTLLKDARIFFNGSNLFLLKDKIKWYDPEGTMKAYPINRNYTFGINLTL